MKHLKVAEARARFAEILDEAEKGAPVVIERHGIRFRVVVEQEPARAAAPPALFEAVSGDVLSGQWTWKAGPKGLAFAPRRKRR